MKKRTKYILDSELISRYAREYNLPYEDAKRVIESVFELARDVFVKNHILNVRGFGTFSVKEKEKFRYRNRTTGQIEHKPMSYVVYFRTSKSLKNELNGSAKISAERYIKKQAAIKRDLVKRGVIPKDSL